MLKKTNNIMFVILMIIIISIILGCKQSPPEVTATPVFDPAPGIFTSSQYITITTATEGGIIRYTSDGSDPSPVYGTIYLSPINITNSLAIKAIAYKENWTDSSIASANYIITGRTATPVFNIPGGIYSSTQNVTITTETSDAIIRYTINGEEPTSIYGIVYSSPVVIDSSITLKAAAFKNNWDDSFTASADFIIQPPQVTIGNNEAVVVSQYNSEPMYMMISSQPAAKQESNDPPSALYPFTINSSVLSQFYIPVAPIVKNIDRSVLSDKFIKQAEGDLIFRETENLLLASRAEQLSIKQSVINSAAPAPVSVGSVWNDVIIFNSSGNILINTTCRYISEHAYFFVDNRNTADMASYLADYGTAFDSIYQVNHLKFGSENDTDSNGKVIIVFSQELITEGYLGYFWSVDKYPKSTFTESNEGDIFYMTTDPAFQGAVIKGTLAHEFQHMIYFDEHYNRETPDTFAWLNEALSQAAEYYNNYIENHLNWIKYGFLLDDYWYGLSLTNWTMYNYGFGAIYIRYLIDRFGDTAIHNMCATDLAGIAAVEAATGVDFNTLFSDFTYAVILSGTDFSSDPRYNFTTLDLQSLQPEGRGGLTTTFSYAAGESISSSLYPYEIFFSLCTGSFNTITLAGADIIGTVFGLGQ